MTAEIAILNKHGIALAADSAVSIGSPQDTSKIYNSVNKLFMLSKHQPIALMIYGGGSFIGVPWEIIVKEYRSALSKNEFSSLSQYADDFWEFITNNRRIFSEEDERLHARQKINTKIIQFRDKTWDTVQKTLDNKEMSNTEFINLFVDTLREKVKQEVDYLNTLENLDNFSDSDHRVFKEQYFDDVYQACRQWFENIYNEIPPDILASIVEALSLAFVKKDFDQSSGIVIAGYGVDEIYPRIASYQVGIMLDGRPRVMFKAGTSNIIEKEFRSKIIPFAQDEVVRTFLTGIDPSIEEVFNVLQHNLADAIIKKIPDDLFKEDISITVRNESIVGSINEFMEGLSGELERIKNQTVLQPILEMLEYLPKDELAEMAETLVNMTAFKRKMSNTLESVGGPIDVAIISKGDGFIWFKRKHYFTRDLNQHFFSNYYNR